MSDLTYTVPGQTGVVTFTTLCHRCGQRPATQYDTAPGVPGGLLHEARPVCDECAMVAHHCAECRCSEREA
jgi:hypothetical protein